MNLFQLLQDHFYNMSANDFGIIAIAAVIGVWFITEIRGHR